MDMNAIPEDIKAFVLFVANHESRHMQLQIKELERRIKALEAPKKRLDPDGMEIMTDAEFAEHCKQPHVAPQFRRTKNEHDYEGSERWSVENGDEVYRDGKWIPIESRFSCPTCGHNGAY